MAAMAKRQIEATCYGLLALAFVAGAAHAHNIPTVDWGTILLDVLARAAGFLVGGLLGALVGLALATKLGGPLHQVVERLRRPTGRRGLLIANLLTLLALGAVVMEDSDRSERPLRCLGGVGGALIGAAVGYHLACLILGEPGIW